MTWPVVYYRAPDGSQPVKDFLDALDDREFAVLENQLERLELFGPQLPFPYSSQLEGELRELRCHIGKRHIRFLYRRSDNLFVLLHAFEKDTQTVPAGDKAAARARWTDFKARMEADPRVPPRAAGADL
jgi:phage-related protein